MPLVLVADDEPITRELIVYKLEAEGYDVIVAEDGRSAITAARENAPDLAVLDVRMPGMSGFDVCGEIRADRTIPSLPVIMLTSSVHDADVAAGYASGADDYILKPFSPRELVSRIRAVLARAARG
jgi:DNA-binding response OmpR family regulator